MTLLRNCMIIFSVFAIIMVSIVLSELFILKDKTITITTTNRSQCGISKMGPQGDIGPAGETGEDGSEGTIGPDGFVGIEGIPIIGPTGPTGRKGKDAVRPKLETLDGNVLNNIFETYSVPQQEDENFLQLTGAEEKINYTRPNCITTTENTNIYGKGYMFGLSYSDIPKCYDVLSTVNIPVDKNYMDRVERANGSYYDIQFSNTNYNWVVAYLVYGDYYPASMKNLYLLSNTRYIDESIPVCFLNITGNLFSTTDASGNTSSFDSKPINYAFLNPAIKGGYGLSTDFEFDQIGISTRKDNYNSLHTAQESITQRFIKGNDYTSSTFYNRMWIYPYVKYIAFLPIVNSETINIDKTLYADKKITVSWTEVGALKYKILVINQNNTIMFNDFKNNGDTILITNHVSTYSYKLYIISVFTEGESMKSKGKPFKLDSST